MIYEIFDYVGYLLAFTNFSTLNKRFFTLLIHSSLPLTIDVPDVWSTDVKWLWDYMIGLQQHRIRCLHLVNWTCVSDFFSIYLIDAAFACLESITLQNIAPCTFLSILPELQSLPCLCHLSLRMETVFVEPPNMTGIYQMLLNLKSLKYLKFSTTDYGIDDIDTFYITTLSVLNEETSNLEYLPNRTSGLHL